jgi:predicted carbohydrate-binding protein with CBM5 and CBM33 domain
VALRPEPSFTTLLAKTVTVVAALTLILIGGLSGSAQAHGSLTDPPSRNYGCWERWGDDHLNPDMANQDPMCWQAWQADPNAMWNWNGLYREGAAGNHQGVVPTVNCAAVAARRLPGTTPWTRSAPGRPSTNRTSSR